MHILQTNVYLGPNLWAPFPVIRHQIDLGPLENWPSGRLGEAFIGGLLEGLPGLHDHGCSYGTSGGFVRRLREENGTWMGHIWEHVALELQYMAGAEVSFGQTRSTGQEGCYDLVYEYRQRDVGLEAGRLGRRLLLHLLPAPVRNQLDEELQEKWQGNFDWEEEREQFIRFAQKRQLGPSTSAIVEEARRRNIPYMRLNDRSLVQLGYGKRQRRIQATITSKSRQIAVDLADDKEEANHLLADLGLPVPRQHTAYNEEEAVRAAEAIGYPVVVKPLDANHGRGVTIELTDEEQVREAFERAQAHSDLVLVEEHIRGDDHRLLVVNDRLIAAARRVPGHVVGDGEHTIAELVEEVNADPRRGVGHEKVLTRLEFDDQAELLMRESGYTRETILPEGEVFFLRTTANLSTGGTAVDVTDQVHSDNREMAVRAVRTLGLDVGGVDFLTEDITQSYREVGGAIVEVNAAPGFRMHLAPSEGRARDVAGPVMDMLFPPGAPSRIPIAAITGTNGKTTTARMLAHILKSAGRTVGLATTDGVYIDGQLTVSGDMTGPISTQMVLRDPTVDSAVLEVARGGLLRGGMGVMQCDVGACLNVSADHLGMDGITTVEEMAEVKGIVVAAAEDTAVLNADDPHCRAMAEKTTAEVCFVSQQPESEFLTAHIRSGGCAFVLEEEAEGDMIRFYRRGASFPLLWTHLIPATMEGKAVHNVQNAMFAAAIAYNLGYSLADIQHGLQSFNPSYFQAPGRLNVYDEHPFRVILDYAHNAAAMEAMGRFIEGMNVRGRQIGVLAVPGDRRDADIRSLVRAAADVFDHYVLKEDDDLRDRAPGEVTGLMREVLLDEGISEKSIEIVRDEQEAVSYTLELAAPGDLVVIFADKVKRCWKQIVGYGSEEPHQVPEEAQMVSAEAREMTSIPPASQGAARPRLVDGRLRIGERDNGNR